MTATLDHTPSPASSRRPWRAPRRPALVAFALIAGIVAILWGLRWWGPVNPEVQVSWTSSDTAARTITLAIENRSRSAVTVESVTLVRSDATIVMVDGVATRTEDRGTTTIASAEIAPSATASVVVDLPPCPEIVTSTTTALHAAVAIRNAVGTTVVVPGDLGGAPSCAISPAYDRPPPTVVLPPAGAQPLDPAIARAGVTSAYWTVYDGSRPPAARLAAIDDPRGVAEADLAAPPPPPGLDLTTLRSDVRQIVFDTPDHAWVDYALATGFSIGPPQVGEAVLVDGTWKVSRSTVCRDLLIIGATCPP